VHARVCMCCISYRSMPNDCVKVTCTCLTHCMRGKASVPFSLQFAVCECEAVRAGDGRNLWGTYCPLVWYTLLETVSNYACSHSHLQAICLCRRGVCTYLYVHMYMRRSALQSVRV